MFKTICFFTKILASLCFFLSRTKSSTVIEQWKRLICHRRTYIISEGHHKRMIDSPGHGRHSNRLCKSVIVYLLILSSTELTNYLICLPATVVTVRVRMIPDFYITIMRTYFPGVMNEFNTSSWKTR